MKHAVAFAGLLLLFLGPSAQAANPAPPTTPTVSPAIAAQYVHPHELIDIGNGRKLNLFCMGKGSPTVIFDSGLSDWSAIWALVQPGVSAHTRACTYDRAGMGYSDRSDDPRSPIGIVEDLQKLIHAAKIATPVVLVGHSLGGFDVKLYAVLHPKEVAGLVLVDPLEERSVARTYDALSAKYGTSMAAEVELRYSPQVAQDVSDYERCAATARAHDLNPASDVYKNCTDPAWPPMGPIIAAERQKIQVKRLYQDTQAAELAHSAAGDPRSDDIYARLFSGHALEDKPLIVLTHSIPDSNEPVDTADLFGWNYAHERTAALSTRGVNRMVPETHHNIEVDRPQAIVDAVNEVLKDVANK